MSLTPTGDKGQRYEVSAVGYPLAGVTNVIGWVDTRAGADRMANAISQAPGCTGFTIRDRWTKQSFTATEANCPGHVASEASAKICARCGVHVDELRPDETPIPRETACDAQRASVIWSFPSGLMFEEALILAIRYRVAGCDIVDVDGVRFAQIYHDGCPSEHGGSAIAARINITGLAIDVERALS